MTLNDKLGFGEDAVFVSDRYKSVSTTGQYNIFSTQNPSGRSDHTFNFLSSKIECAEFRGSRVIVALVGLMPSWHRAFVSP